MQRLKGKIKSIDKYRSEPCVNSDYDRVRIVIDFDLRGGAKLYHELKSISGLSGMTIEELTQELKEEIRQPRTKEEALKQLQKAGILDENGDFDSRYFSEETIRKDREKRGK